MKAAVRAVQNDQYGLRAAAKPFNVSMTSLHSRIKAGEFYEASMGTNT